MLPEVALGQIRLRGSASRLRQFKYADKPTDTSQVNRVVVGNGRPGVSFRPHPPTDLAVKDWRVVHANLDYFIDYEVTVENRGPYTTLGDRGYQVITFDSANNINIVSLGQLPAGMAPNATSNTPPIRVDIYAKLLWVFVLDGKDQNGWNDFAVLWDGR